VFANTPSPLACSGKNVLPVFSDVELFSSTGDDGAKYVPAAPHVSANWVQ